MRSEGSIASAPVRIPAITTTLTSEDAERIARTFKALSDPTRVRLLSLIAGGIDGRACTCDLTAAIGLTQATVSHHMKILFEAGLVTRAQSGKWTYYAVAVDGLRTAASILQTS